MQFLEPNPCVPDTAAEEQTRVALIINQSLPERHGRTEAPWISHRPRNSLSFPREFKWLESQNTPEFKGMTWVILVLDNSRSRDREPSGPL